MSEYELLRAEIMQNATEIMQYNCILYSVVAAIVAFSFQSDNYLSCLIPYIAIFPILFLCHSKYKGMCMIGAYLNVFLEGSAYNWERRNQEADYQYYTTHSKGVIGRLIYRWRQQSQYYVVSLSCSFASVYKLLCSNFTDAEKCVRIVILLLFTIVALTIIHSNTLSFPECRKSYIEYWNIIKKREQFQNEADNNEI